VRRRQVVGVRQSANGFLLCFSGPLVSSQAEPVQPSVGRTDGIPRTESEVEAHASDKRFDQVALIDKDEKADSPTCGFIDQDLHRFGYSRCLSHPSWERREIELLIGLAKGHGHDGLDDGSKTFPMFRLRMMVT
jgi:hypothetical protein